MDDNILYVGMRIEMVKPKNRVEDDSKQRVTYVSQIMDMDPELLTCAMPIYEGHIVPLETGSEYEVLFYSKTKTYSGICRIVSRGKEGNIFICKLKLLSNLSKFQRREFFRLSCTMDVQLTSMSEIDILSYIDKKRLPDKSGGSSEKGITVDISGGGLRVLSNREYEKGAFVALDFILRRTSGVSRINIPGQIVQSAKSDNNKWKYDQRIQFKAISSDIQEEIVKYIFEEQRRRRKKERE